MSRRSNDELADELEAMARFENTITLTMADNKVVASRDRKVYLFREAAAALREPEIPVTDAAIEALAESLQAESADAYRAWLKYIDSPYKVLRRALKAAMKARETQNG